MLHLVSIQASAIKSTFECLKDVLNDVNIYFRPNGIYMTTSIPRERPSSTSL